MKFKKRKNAGQFDKFYTKESIVDYIMSLIDITQYEVIIEPSAGDGAFSNKIKNCIAYDIDPQNNKIIKCDFLTIDNIYGPSNKVLIIGNPPYGTQSSLAFQFIKKSFTIADTVAFILPKSFKKASYKNKVPLSHECVFELDLTHDAFLVNNNTYSVPTVFQIWKKVLNGQRKKIKMQKTNAFIFCKDRNDADISFRRVGVNAGSISKDLYKSKASHYFIKIYDEPARQFFSFYNWDDVKNNTVGICSISKHEIIDNYHKYIETYVK